MVYLARLYGSASSMAMSPSPFASRECGVVAGEDDMDMVLDVADDGGA